MTQPIHVHNAPGWYETPQGLFVRTDHQADGPVYVVTLFLQGALDAETMQTWKQSCDEIILARAEAGQKGAYGKLRTLSQSFHSLFLDIVEHSLRAQAGSRISLAQACVLAQVVEATAGCTLFSLSICSNHMHAVLSLSGEVGIDALSSEWKEAIPELTWDEDAIVDILPQDETLTPRWITEEIPANTLIPMALDAAGNATEETAADFRHTTVLLHETVDMLAPESGKLIIDATLGGGGHTELLLERGANVWGIDQDPAARHAASMRLARFGNRFKAIAGNFRDIESILASQGVSRVDGLLADIGISSHQIDTASRGFSFREDGPLDMRMNPQAALSAQDIVNQYDEKELSDIIWQYGEERASRAIARAIIRHREQHAITTTKALADIVASILPRKGKQHPATRTFQALRIAVNDELGALDSFLSASTRLLNPEGRIAIITFHSLEDRRVKHFFEHHSKAEIDRKEWPEPRPNPDYIFSLINKHPITPSDEELNLNPRSRSAKLRGAVKIN